MNLLVQYWQVYFRGYSICFLTEREACSMAKIHIWFWKLSKPYGEVGKLLVFSSKSRIPLSYCLPNTMLMSTECWCQLPSVVLSHDCRLVSVPRTNDWWMLSYDGTQAPPRTSKHYWKKGWKEVRARGIKIGVEHCPVIVWLQCGSWDDLHRISTKLGWSRLSGEGKGFMGCHFFLKIWM